LVALSCRIATRILKNRPLVAFLAVTLLLIHHALHQILVLEGGFWYTLIQCMYKSYSDVNDYARDPDRAPFPSVTSVLAAEGGTRRGFLSGAFPTDKDTRHNYTQNYNWLMAPYQETATHVLEVGVKKGGSIKLWREYFSADAMIYGIDIDKAVPTFPLDAHVKIITTSSNSKPAMERALAKLGFDVIVDDGRHTESAIKQTWDILWPRLKGTGLYIVEDWPYGLLPDSSYGCRKAREDCESLVMVLSDSSIHTSVPEEMLVIVPRGSVLYPEVAARLAASQNAR
jgi:hypothetical protein